MQRVSRLKKELQLLANQPPPGISCWQKCDQMDELRAQILGSADSPYEGGIFNLEIIVPERYPFEPPKIRFLTPIYHPNIDTAGRICLDILKLPPKRSVPSGLSYPPATPREKRSDQLCIGYCDILLEEIKLMTGGVHRKSGSNLSPYCAFHVVMEGANLAGAWRPSLNLSTVLTSIHLLMSEPNPDDPLMADISSEFKYNRQSFLENAKKWTLKHATQTKDKIPAHLKENLNQVEPDVTKERPIPRKRFACDSDNAKKFCL